MNSKVTALCFGFLLIILWNSAPSMAASKYPRLFGGSFDTNGWEAKNTIMKGPNAYSVDVRVLKEKAGPDLMKTESDIHHMIPGLGLLRSRYFASEKTLLSKGTEPKTQAWIRKITTGLGKVRALPSRYARILVALDPEPNRMEPWNLDTMPQPADVRMTFGSCPVPRVINYRIYWWPGDSAASFLRELGRLSSQLPSIADGLGRSAENAQSGAREAQGALRELRSVLGAGGSSQMKNFLELADQELEGLNRLSSKYARAVQDKIDLERARRTLASVNVAAANMTSDTLRRCSQVYAGMRGRDEVPLPASRSLESPGNGDSPQSGGATLDLTGQNDPYGLGPAWAPASARVGR